MSHVFVEARFPNNQTCLLSIKEASSNNTMLNVFGMKFSTKTEITTANWL